MSNRYTVLRPTTFDDIPLYQPNYAALDQVLGQKEQQYNLAEASIDALMPDALSAFQDEADAYHQQWRDRIDNLPNLYKNSFREGNKELNKLIRDAKREIQDPNSEYSHFANTKKQYLEGVKRIEEFHKKDPVKYNKQWAMNKLQNQLKGAKWADFYDQQQGKVLRNFVDPELTPFVDVQKDVLDVISKIKMNQDTEFKDWIRPGFIEKIKSQELTPELISQVTNQLLNHPKYKDQLAIEQWYQTKDVDFEAAEAAKKQQTLEQRENLFAQLDNIQNLTPAEIKAYQAELGVTVDGIYGDETQEAIDAYKQDVDAKITAELTDPMFSQKFQQQYAQDLTRQPYIDMATKAFARTIVDRSLIVDQPYLTRLKISASRNNTNKLIRMMESFKPKEETDYLATSYKGYTMDAFNKERENAAQTLSDAEANLNAITRDPKVRQLFSVPNDVPGLMGAVMPNRSMTNDEIANSIRVAEEVNKMNISPDEKIAKYQALTGTTPEQAELQFNEITVGGVGRQFGEVYNAWYEADSQVKMVEDVAQDVTDTYFRNEGEKKLESINNDLGWEGNSSKETSRLLNKSLNYSNVISYGGNYYGLNKTTGKRELLDAKEGEQLSQLYWVSKETTGGAKIENKAIGHLEDMKEEIEEAIVTNPDYAKAMRAYDIRGGKDTYLANYMNELDARLNDPAGITGFIREATGTANFQFAAEDGSEEKSYMDLKKFKSDFVSKPSGNTLIVTGEDKDGKRFTSEFKVPSTHEPRVRNAIMQMGIAGYENGDEVAFEIAANNWANSNGANKKIPMFKAMKPNPKMAKRLTFQTNPSQPNSNVEFVTYGTPMAYRPDPNGATYYIHLVDTPTGAKSYIPTRRVYDGKSSKDVIVPIDGYTGANTSLEDITSSINKLEMPRYFEKEVTFERQPTGTILDDSQLNAILGFSGQAINNINELTDD